MPAVKRGIDWVGYFLMFTGVDAILLAFASDQLNLGGQAGFGEKQKVILLAGLFLFLVGIIFWTKSGRSFLNEWINLSVAERQPILIGTFREKTKVVLMTAAWFGLITGLLEISYRIYNRITANTIINLSRHFIWMTPLIYLVLFVFAGLLLLVIELLIPKITNFTVEIFFFTFIGSMCVYYTSPKLYFYAILVLALGISFQVSRFLSKRSNLFFRSVSTSLPWMVTGVLAAAAFFIGFWQ